MRRVKLDVLTCSHCGYELAGLVRGPEAVVCPECGERTEHVDGAAVRAATPWDAMNRGTGRWMLVPTLCASIAAILGVVNGRIWAEIAVVAGLVVVSIASVFAGVAAATSRPLASFDGRDRIILGFQVVFVAALCAAAWTLGMLGLLLMVF